MIDFTKKISTKRPYNFDRAKFKSEEKRNFDINDIQIKLESDRGRIINSAAIRRLQQKTQVFPLERNAAVRSRLTHSLEVQQNGRYIVQKLFKKISCLDKFNLAGLDNAFESLVEMACLMHDIGNPPFGHFGEEAIKSWFKTHTSQIFDTRISEEFNVDPILKESIIRDIQNFEGNAQAIRLIYSLQRLNLTFMQSACILKYTRPAWIKANKTNMLTKKPGFYLSEEQFIIDMQTVLNMEKNKRYPLTYIMEAADDISYCLADIEDAVDKGILSLEQLEKYLIDEYIVSGGDPTCKSFKDIYQNKTSFTDIVKFAMDRSKKEEVNKESQFFIFLRVNLIHNLIDHAADRFIKNIDKVYDGSFDEALLEDNSPAHKVVKTFKQIGYKYVFINQEVHTLEIQGYKIITGLLNNYKCILELDLNDLNDIINNKKSIHLIESRLFERIGNKYIKAYQTATNIKKNVDQKNYILWELYFRNRLIQDHISGMNDQFALDEFKLFNVS